LVKAEGYPQALPILFGGILTDHIVDRVADELKQREGYESNHQHDDDGLKEPLNDKGEHGVPITQIPKWRSARRPGS
jgi:hypothetical protein